MNDSLASFRQVAIPIHADFEAYMYQKADDVIESLHMQVRHLTTDANSSAAARRGIYLRTYV